MLHPLIYFSIYGSLPQLPSTNDVTKKNVVQKVEEHNSSSQIKKLGNK